MIVTTEDTLAAARSAPKKQWLVNSSALPDPIIVTAQYLQQAGAHTVAWMSYDEDGLFSEVLILGADTIRMIKPLEKLAPGLAYVLTDDKLNVVSATPKVDTLMEREAERRRERGE